MKPGSLRWWFENRETGDITVAQAPNPPLFVALAGWLVDLVFGGAVGSVGRWVSIAALTFWGCDEIVRGVNPWRRLLGSGSWRGSSAESSVESETPLRSVPLT